jgi:hypothetical protein
MKPRDLLRFMPFLPGTFGKAELELAAVLVVLWHYEERNEDWTPVSCRTVIEWSLKTELGSVVSIGTNPFFLPDFEGLRIKGFVEGWDDADTVGMFSTARFERLAKLIERHAQSSSPS